MSNHCAMYIIDTTYSLMNTFVDHVVMDALYLVISGQVFVVCLTAEYTYELWRNPKRQLFE